MFKFPYMCRFCLIPTQMSRTVDIFGETNEVPKKILELVNLKVEKGDGLPQEVCVLCRDQLNMSVTFKRQVAKADAMLREHLAKQLKDSVSCCNSAPLITGDPLSEEVVHAEVREKGQEQGEFSFIKDAPDLNPTRNTDLCDTNLANVSIKVEDNLVVAEPWPEEQWNSDTVAKGSAEESKDNCDSKKEVNKNEIYEENVCQRNQVNLENGDEDSCAEERSEEEAIAERGNQVKLDLKCTDHIECSCQFCTENKLDSRIAIEHDNEPNCELCGKKFEMVNQLKEHQVEHREPSGEWYKCPNCERRFPSLKGVHAHQREHTHQREQNESIQQEHRVRRSSRATRAPERHVVPHYSCSKCERMFNDQIALDSHEKSHLVVSFKCNHCGKKFSTKELLVKHIQSVHLARTRTRNHGHQCNICGKYFESRSNMFSHMRSHKSTVHLCEVCGKTVSLNAYPAHKRSHMNAISQEVFQCDLCEKKFNNKISLRTHKSSYHGPLKYTCEVCGKQFTTMALMKHHQNVHSGKRDHTCQVCGRAFTLKVTLKSHMRIHTGEMPYGCDNCGRHFTWKTTYRNHVATCKKPQVNVDMKPRVDTHYSNIQHIPQGLPQDLPIDYSEDAKCDVPIDYSEDAKYRDLPVGETKLFPSALNIREEIKYPYQQPISFPCDIKPLNFTGH